mgnify:CR=1 FL=1
MVRINGCVEEKEIEEYENGGRLWQESMELILW